MSLPLLAEYVLQLAAIQPKLTSATFHQYCNQLLRPVRVIYYVFSFLFLIEKLEAALVTVLLPRAVFRFITT